MTVDESKLKLRDLARGISIKGTGVDAGGPWGFADTLVTDSQPTAKANAFYPEPRAFVSPYPGEMAWVFSRVVQATRGLPGYGLWKEELFGRLGNVGNSYVAADEVDSARELALVIVLEALLFVEKLDSPDGVEVLSVAVDNEIADDVWSLSQWDQPSWRRIQESWAQLGIDISA